MRIGNGKKNVKMLLCANYTCDFLLSVMVDREFH